LKLASTVSKLFLLDKPAGISSFKALGALKRNIGTKKVGHAGTLDPFATGLLLVMSGKMTKSIHLLTGMDKEYEAVIRFGEETDTLDTEGEVIAEADLPEYRTIVDSLHLFSGCISQRPPVYSAIKIDGRRAYSQARRGAEVKMPERIVHIHDFQLIDWNPPDLRVKISCSKGTYIRSIARDLGLAAGSRAYCHELRRLSIGPFIVDKALPPESVSEQDGLSPVDFFKSIDVPVVTVSESAAGRMRMGIPVHTLRELPEICEEQTLFIDDRGLPAALVVLKGGKAVYNIVFDDV